MRIQVTKDAVFQTGWYKACDVSINNGTKRSLVCIGCNVINQLNCIWSKVNLVLCRPYLCTRIHFTSCNCNMWIYHLKCIMNIFRIFDVSSVSHNSMQTYAFTLCIQYWPIFILFKITYIGPTSSVGHLAVIGNQLQNKEYK